jgi:hypothetical protein
MSGSEDEFSDELDEFEESAADDAKGTQHYLVSRKEKSVPMSI